MKKFETARRKRYMESAKERTYNNEENAKDQRKKEKNIKTA